MVAFPSSCDSHKVDTVAIIQKAPLVKSISMVSADVNGMAFLSQHFQLVTWCSGGSHAEKRGSWKERSPRLKMPSPGFSAGHRLGSQMNSM